MSLSLLAPQFLWALLAIPLVILLHFIRSRRRRYEVSALFLWQQAKDIASQRRRFSPTWLLIVQLLFVALAAFALARPSLSFQGAPDRVLVIDASASMSAIEEQGSRLAQAKQAADEILRDSGQVALIRAGLAASIETALTTNHAEVRRDLNNLVAADASADISRAVDLARAIAPDAEIHVFSDAELRLADDIRMHPVGVLVSNMGIASFDLRHQQATVNVVSTFPRPQQVDLLVTRADQIVAQTNLLVPAGGQVFTTFPLDGAAGFYRATLNVPQGDALELDNQAIAGSRALNILISPPAAELERAFLAIPGVNIRVTQALPLSLTGVDVLVSSTIPAELETGKFVFYRAPVQEGRVHSISDWNRADPLMRFVDLTGARVTLADDSLALPDIDWQELAQTQDLRPVMWQSDDPRIEAIAFDFNPAQTDIVRRQAFPLLITNAVSLFRAEERLALGTRFSTPALASGRDVQAALVPDVYTLDEVSYAVSLLSAEESRLTVPETIVETASQTNPVNRSEREQVIGLWLLLAALVLILLEWWLWARGRGAWLSRAA